MRRPPQAGALVEFLEFMEQPTRQTASEMRSEILLKSPPDYRRRGGQHLYREA